MIFKHRLFVLIRINALLRNARRLVKHGQTERAKTFIEESKNVIDAFFEAR